MCCHTKIWEFIKQFKVAGAYPACIARVSCCLKEGFKSGIAINYLDGSRLENAKGKRQRYTFIKQLPATVHLRDRHGWIYYSFLKMGRWPEEPGGRLKNLNKEKIYDLNTWQN